MKSADSGHIPLSTAKGLHYVFLNLKECMQVLRCVIVEPTIFMKHLALILLVRDIRKKKSSHKYLHLHL
jgi:hypothetical protein